MKKVISLLKASLTEGMSIFKINDNNKMSNRRKKILPIFLFLIVMYGIGTYAYLFAKPLSKMGLTYVMIPMIIVFVSIYTIIEGFYKSQNMLFDCKDNNLLLAMPIKKKDVFFVRLFKFYVFQLMYDTIFLLPTFIIYAYFESPGISFYLISFLMLLLVPIIPLIIASLIGYIIKAFSVNFKKSKNVQTIIFFIILACIFYFSFNMEGIINNAVNNVNTINNIISKVYYPVNLYVKLINNFRFMDLIKLILINIIPFILFIYLGSIYYFKIIFKTKSFTKKYSKTVKYNSNNALLSLVKKEAKTYFNIPVYIVNTFFGMILLIILTLLLSINISAFTKLLQMSAGMEISKDMVIKYAPIFYLQMVTFTGAMTCITSSSISIEGKSFNILKSYPVSEKTIFSSKILFSLLLMIPIILICDVIFFINFKPSFLYIIYILAFSILVPMFSSLFGLFINLKYPKLKWNNETEVVKQSTSTMICAFSGMGLFLLSVLFTVIFIKKNTLVSLIEIAILCILNIILILLLNSSGVTEFKKINY